MKRIQEPMPIQSPSRRTFLQWSGAAAAALGLSGGSLASSAQAAKAAKANKPDKPSKSSSVGEAIPEKPTKLKLGLASYSTRKFDLDQTLEIARRVGMKYICLKSMHLPLDAKPEEIAAAAAKVKQAGLILYGGGVISMQKESQIDQAFDYAKAAGMQLMVIAPIAETLPLIEKKVQQYNIAVAIHNHGPTDKHFPTPESVYEAVRERDKRMGLCMDIGHTVRVGADLNASTEKYFDRLLDVHMKDVTEATPKGHGIQAGRGVIDIPKFLGLLIRLKYPGVLSFEYEEDPDDPLPGLAESVGYTRGVMAAL
jgi:inosose dehydratase